jgi:hypothetical protein
LTMGTPQEKAMQLAALAREAGIPLDALAQMPQQPQVDPYVLQTMREVQELRNSMQGITSFYAQQEAAQIQQELSKFQDAEKYPHFEQVRQTMAQLLESGFAQDPETAYQKAVRMNDDVWST